MVRKDVRKEKNKNKNGSEAGRKTFPLGLSLPSPVLFPFFFEGGVR